MNPLSLSQEEIVMRIKVCEQECRAARVTGWKDRRKHLHQCAQESRERGEDEAAEQTLQIIQREKEHSFWRRINHTMGKARGRSVSVVQVDDAAGNVVEHTTQESVQTAIWDEIHKKRFYLAEEAPICQGRLRGDFGYLSVSPMAKFSTAPMFIQPTLMRTLRLSAESVHVFAHSYPLIRSPSK